MQRDNILKGIVLVAAGASSYGMLATFVKLAYQEGFTTPEVSLAQISIGLIFMWCATFLQRKKSTGTQIVTKQSDVAKLMVLGTSLGLTTLFYYIAVKYISVSLAIVLLMQTTWISVVLEAILNKSFPSPQKITAVILVLFGTILTTNTFDSSVSLDYRGVLFGFLSALSFTTTMFASNRIATYLPPYKKSSFMLTGGFIVILSYCLMADSGPFNFSVFWKWGIILGLFGTIIPPLAFNIGFPKIGLGLGSIVSALEIPVSIIMAYMVLHEQVVLIQIVGVCLILLAVVLMNIKVSRKAVYN